MANIPTLTQLTNQILADLESALNITIPSFGKSFLRPLAIVLAGALWLMYLRLAIVQKNTFPGTADPVAIGGTLEDWGYLKLGRYPYPATQGQYVCSVIASAGATIEGGTRFISDDSALSPSKLFALDQTYICTGSGDEITLRALEAGDGSALMVGNTLTVTVPIALVGSIVTVTSELVQPEAAEDTEDYRRKILDSFRILPQGGSPADYRLWASEVSGIVQTYPYTASGFTNQVNLFIEGDTANGVPTSQDITNVQNSIELPTADRPARKPITDIVNYIAVTPKIIDINISGFQDLDAAIEALILSAMESKLSEIRPFVDSIDIVSERNDYFDLNVIILTVLESRPGSVFGAVTMDVDGNPETSYTFTNGDIPNLGVITYV